MTVALSVEPHRASFPHIDGHHCNLVSRKGHTFKHWPQLCQELAHRQGARRGHRRGSVCLDAQGRSNVKSLLFRGEWAYFYAFDLLAVDGEDLREWLLVERKRRPRGLIPSLSTWLLYMNHIIEQGRSFFRVACAHDLEVIVAKPANGRYSTPPAPIESRSRTRATGR
jgi:bifunctional non-homologous end joining protein LigD